MLVWGDRLAEQAKPLVAVALRHVAEIVVVGVVLFDDVNDVLEKAGLPHPLRHGTSGSQLSRRPFLRPAIVAGNDAAELAEVLPCLGGDELDDSNAVVDAESSL